METKGGLPTPALLCLYTYMKESKNIHNLEACNCHCNLRITDTIWAVLKVKNHCTIQCPCPPTNNVFLFKQTVSRRLAYCKCVYVGIFNKGHKYISYKKVYFKEQSEAEWLINIIKDLVNNL